MGMRQKAAVATIVALLAVGIYGSASARGAEFHSSSSHTTKTLVPKTAIVLTTTVGQETCEVTGKETTVAGFTSWKEERLNTGGIGTGACHLIIFGSTVSATMAMNGCVYVYKASGTMGFSCPENSQIEMSAVGCTVKYGSQEGLSSISYTNNGNHVDTSLNVKGIKYSHSGFTCGTGSGSNGTLTGTETVSGKDAEGKAVKLWYE
jgi:hypothetical protein